VQQSLIFMYQAILPVTLIFVTVVITFSFAFLSWHYVEKPMLTKKVSTANFINKVFRLKHNKI